MNPNIKVINENLWTVNFSHVGMGFIKELTFNKTLDSDFMTLTQDGKLIMNSGDEVMMRYLPTMKVIMGLPNRLIGNEKGFCHVVKVFVPKLDNLTDQEIVEFIEKQNLNNFRLVYDTACKWELKRRQLQKQYIREHWFSIGINKVKRFLKRKVGVKL